MVGACVVLRLVTQEGRFWGMGIALFSGDREKVLFSVVDQIIVDGICVGFNLLKTVLKQNLLHSGVAVVIGQRISATCEIARKFQVMKTLQVRVREHVFHDVVANGHFFAFRDGLSYAGQIVQQGFFPSRFAEQKENISR